MKKNLNTSKTLNRMKTLMNYGVNEGKESPFSSIEYQKEGADGKVYGIIREGSKYYIKVADKKKSGEKLVNEDFNYIGGFRNRKENEYNGFANAQKNFELKLKSLNEAKMNNKVLVESWDLDKKEVVLMEASNKMKNEISRQRNIMENAKQIAEGNKEEPIANLYNGGKGEKQVDTDILNSQKPNFKPGEHKTGKASDANKGFTDVDVKECGFGKSGLSEATNVLAWRRNGDPKYDHYMDKTHGTEIGDGDPFDLEEEDDSMVYDHPDDQNSPKPGTNEIGDGKPFGVNEAEEGEDVMPDDDTEYELEMDDDVPEDDDDDLLDDEEESAGTEEFYDDLGERMDNMEELLGNIADKLGIDIPTVDGDEYNDDDELYIDVETDDDEEPEEEANIELELDDDAPAEEEMENEARMRNKPVVYETNGFKRAIREASMKAFSDNGRVPSGNMNRLNDFGKHPAWRKKVMTLPPKDFNEFDGYYDMNDDSVRNDTPYATNIGSGDPFTIAPDSIDNAIAETYDRLKKKSSRR